MHNATTEQAKTVFKKGNEDCLARLYAYLHLKITKFS